MCISVEGQCSGGQTPAKGLAVGARGGVWVHTGRAVPQKLMEAGPQGRESPFIWDLMEKEVLAWWASMDGAERASATQVVPTCQQQGTDHMDWHLMGCNIRLSSKLASLRNT